jgi:hypothetical protein
MDLLSAIRAQLPVTQGAPHSPPERPVSVPAAISARPVSETLRRDAPQPPSAVATQVSVQLSERDEGQHPAAQARAAAEAAREAYIKASIAAGISPLPLP